VQKKCLSGKKRAEDERQQEKRHDALRIHNADANAVAGGDADVIIAGSDEILRTTYGYAIKATANQVQLTSNQSRMVFHLNIRHQNMLRDIRALQHVPKLHWKPSQQRQFY